MMFNAVPVGESQCWQVMQSTQPTLLRLWHLRCHSFPEEMKVCCNASATKWRIANSVYRARDLQYGARCIAAFISYMLHVWPAKLASWLRDVTTR